MDIFDKFKTRGNIGRFSHVAEGYFVFPELEGPLGNRMKFKGKEVICWSINNYLGLANHPEVREIDTQASKDWGMAYPMGARMMSGATKYHTQLENELADFVKRESAMLVNFGYQGMSSGVDCLLGRHDVCVYDGDSHACIIDGVRMHQGKRYMFKHNDMESLDKNLKRATKMVEQTGGGILVISEGVFGMSGNQGKLKEILAMKSKYNFRLLVDDAHGFGTLGATGAGAGEEQGIMGEIDVYFSTFAKSMASIGAFFAGDKDVMDFMKYNMRSQMFAKSVPMPIVIGALKRLDMVRTMPELRSNLWRNVSQLQSGLKEAGFDIGTTNSCVTPVYMKGGVGEAMALTYDLRENHNIFCSIVVYPVVPKGTIILRLIPTSVHTPADIKETIAAFKVVQKGLSSGAYKTAAEQYMSTVAAK